MKSDLAWRARVQERHMTEPERPAFALAGNRLAHLHQPAIHRLPEQPHFRGGIHEPQERLRRARIDSQGLFCPSAAPTRA